jgi:hypothetical protein
MARDSATSRILITLAAAELVGIGLYLMGTQAQGVEAPVAAGLERLLAKSGRHDLQAREIRAIARRIPSQQDHSTHSTAWVAIPSAAARVFQNLVCAEPASPSCIRISRGS